MSGALKRTPKFGERVAAAIEAEIRDLGWPVGRMLGNEAELIARYGVSRAVLREAIRQVEQRGIAEMRRGRSGGLMVAAPVESAVVRSLTTYFEAIDVSLKEILEAQLILEVHAAALACERIDAAGIRLLRDLAARLTEPSGIVQIDAAPHTDIRAAIAHAAGNRGLALFIRSLNMSTVDMRSMLIGDAMQRDYRARVEGSIAKKRALIEAIVSSNAPRARQIVEQDASEQMQLYDLFARLGVRRGEVQSVLRASEAVDDRKMSQAVMLKLAQDVARLGAAPGERIGSESDMLLRYGVGRAVFREAIRPLEQHGVVKMRRGAKGGLFVAEPDPAGTVAITRDYFAFMRLPPAELFDIRSTIECDAIELAAIRGSDRQIALFRVRYDEECRHGRMAEERFHTELAAISGNRVLALLIRILSHWHQESGHDQIIFSDDIGLGHGRMLEALEARDAALARRYMTDHLKIISRRHEAAGS